MVSLSPQHSASQTLMRPPTVKVVVNARVVTVTGKKGTITREFKHINLDMQHIEAERKIRVDLWFGNRKQLACIRTICSHVENMVTGVRIGYLYKMKFVYSHFPINVTVSPDAKVVEIRNFMGEKRVRKVHLMDGVTAVRTKDVKDQLEISGIDITKVSLGGKYDMQLLKSCVHLTLFVLWYHSRPGPANDQHQEQRYPQVPRRSVYLYIVSAPHMSKMSCDLLYVSSGVYVTDKLNIEEAN